MPNADPRNFLDKVIGACLGILVGATAVYIAVAIGAYLPCSVTERRRVHADVVHEFVEPGNSAQTIEKRPVFRELLQYISDNPNVDYVIIYMRSRAFRNLGDAVVTKRKLESFGIRLLSSKEDFGEGYMADAMEAVTDIFNEIEVRRNGEDISQKLEHKARNGGTIGRAKIGYLNIRVEVDGRLINSIGLDPERAPLVKEAFELYATGEYSLETLVEEMADRGLRTRRSRSRPSRPIPDETMRVMLRDPYYTGAMVYKGQVIPHGRHEAIIETELFERVQAVLDLRARPGQRDRVLMHYLKGMLYCGRCKTHGRTSRLLYTQARGRSGDYFEYFVCRGRQQGLCDLPHLPAEQVEIAVEGHYINLGVGPEFVGEVEADLATFMAESQNLAHELHAKLSRQLSALDGQEDRLIDLAAEDSLSRAKIQSKVNSIRLERQRIQESLGRTNDQLAIGAQRLLDCIRLIADPVKLYTEGFDQLRRNLNQTFFSHFYVDDVDQVRISASVLREPFNELQAAGDLYRVAKHERSPVHQNGASAVTRLAHKADLLPFPCVV
jgi:site-specific DNA recombinase